VQRGKRKDYYSLNGNTREHDPGTMLTYIYDKIKWQLDRLDEMNPDPTGEGIARSVRSYSLSASKGLLIVVMQVCSTSRAGLTSNIAVPATSRMLAQWIRDQIGSANVPVDALDSLGQILCEFVRPTSRDTDIESFELVQFFTDAACDTAANTAVRLAAILADDGNGGVLAAPPTPIACISAYKKWVAFKRNTLGIEPVAAPTTMTNNGWCLMRAVQLGNSWIVLSGVSTENHISDVDFLKVVLLEDYNAASVFVTVFANWNLAPYMQAEVQWQRASQRVGTTSLLFADNSDLKLIRGPTLTMWPAPFQNPVGASIAGQAPGGGLLPVPLPLGAPAPADPAPGVGGNDPNAALAALMAIPGVAAALAAAAPAPKAPAHAPEPKAPAVAHEMPNPVGAPVPKAPPM
jgi:hypothetical protein